MPSMLFYFHFNRIHNYQYHRSSTNSKPSSDRLLHTLVGVIIPLLHTLVGGQNTSFAHPGGGHNTSIAHPGGGHNTSFAHPGGGHNTSFTHPGGGHNTSPERPRKGANSRDIQHEDQHQSSTYKRTKRQSNIDREIVCEDRRRSARLASLQSHYTQFLRLEQALEANTTSDYQLRRPLNMTFSKISVFNH